MPDLVASSSQARSSAFLSQGNTPTITAGPALGTNAPASVINGNNAVGKISFTTAALSVVAGTVLTMNFNGYTYPGPMAVMFSAANDNFSTVLNLIYTVPTTTSVALITRAGLGVNTTYSGFYTIVGY